MKPEELQQLIDQINTTGEGLRTAGTITRHVETVKRDDGTEKEEVTYDLSFSSETEEGERWFGVEVLGHRDGEVDMTWINSGRAPLLLDHDPRQQIGVIKSAKVSNRRGTAAVRFGAGALAKEIQRDVDDGIRGNVSVGYEVLNMELVEEKKNQPPKYRVTRWKPREVSLVAMPYDTTVGVGRSKPNTPQTPKVQVMNTPENEDAAKAAAAQAASNTRSAEDAVTKERKRIDGILSIGKAHRLTDDAEKAIRDGMPLADFQAAALQRLAAGHKPLGEKYDNLSTKEKEDVKRYSLRTAIVSQLKGGNLTGFEAEMHQEGVREAQQAGVTASGLVVPYIVLHRNFLQRELTVTVDTKDSAKNLVAEDLQAGSFIDVLRNRMVLAQLGARFLSGLVGNIAIPRKSSGVSGQWLTEKETMDDENIVLDQVTMTPRRCGTSLPYTKQLLLQSSIGVEQMIRDDFANALALKLEAGALAGTGQDGQPTGILTLGTNSNPLTLGTHGGAPTYAKFVELETLVNNANAGIARRAYLLNSKVNGYTKVTERFTNTGKTIKTDDGMINGYPAPFTNALPGTLSKGTSGDVLSAIVYGNWEDLLIGMWGGLDIVVDEFTKAKSAEVQITANMFADVATRYPKAFSFTKEAATA